MQYFGAKLHLVHPLGFFISEKAVQRSGLDYWDKLDIEEHDSFQKFLEKYNPENYNMFFATTKAKHIYSDVDYSKMNEVFLVFGKETKGLPEDILKKYIDKTIRIPMREGLRSLNLSNYSTNLIRDDEYLEDKDMIKLTYNFEN